MKHSTDYEIDSWQFSHNLRQHKDKLRAIRKGKSHYSPPTGTKHMLGKSMVCKVSRDREITMENQSLLNRLISITNRKPILTYFKSKRKEENLNNKSSKYSLDLKLCKNMLGFNKLPPISDRKHKTIMKKHRKENNRSDTTKDKCYKYVGASDYSKHFTLKAITPVPDLGMEAPESIKTIKEED